MKALKLSVLSALLLSAAALAQAKGVEVREVTAEEAIVNGDKAKAREVAIKKALREAVEQVAGVLISSDTLTANATLVSDRIYSRSEGYVKSWKLVGQPKEEGGVLSVTVRAEVGTQELDKDLQLVKALITRLGNRKLVILIQEQTLQVNGNVSTSGVLSTVLTDGFKADGWTIIDPSFASGEVAIASVVGTGQITDAAIKRIRDISKADYIVYGKAGFRNQEGTGMMGAAKGAYFPVTGEYELAAFATDSGTQLTNVAGKINFDPKKDAFPALSYERSAHDLALGRGGEILGLVRKAVVDYLANAEQNGNRLEMTLMGLSYGGVQNFKKALSGQTGVRDVGRGTFSNGKATFDVTFIGSSEELAEQIADKKFSGKTANVTGVSGNTIEVTMAK